MRQLSLRAEAVDELRLWPAPDRRQEQLRDEFLDYLAAHDDAVWRSAVPAHTGAMATANAESLDVRWFGWDQLPVGIEPTIVTMLAAGREHLS
jgi:hypothetical protein